MKSNYKRLGQFIHEVDIRNISEKKNNLLGVSVSKQFIPSIANTIGTDWSKYKIIKKRQFCYIPDTSRRGDKIAVALLKDYEEGLVSQAYIVFYVDEESLLPEYLLLWFIRTEFDRYARFKSHGSVREIFDFGKLCEVELPVPDIKEQKRIVEEYQLISDRIAIKQAINNNLLEQSNAILNQTLKNSKLESIRITKYCKLLNGYAFKSESYLSSGKYRILTIGNVQDGSVSIDDCNFIDTIPNNVPKHCVLSKYDLLMSLTGNVGRLGFVIYDNCMLNQRVCKITPYSKDYSYGLFLFLKSKELNIQMNKMSDGGTAQQNLSTISLENREFMFLNEEDFKKFCLFIKPYIEEYLNNLEQINCLEKIKKSMLSLIKRNR